MDDWTALVLSRATARELQREATQFRLARLATAVNLPADDDLPPPWSNRSAASNAATVDLTPDGPARPAWSTRRDRQSQDSGRTGALTRLLDDSHRRLSTRTKEPS